MRSYRLLVVDNDVAGRRLYRSLEKQAEAGACHVRQAVNGAAGLRADYSPTYYAAFLIDPDGNNVEAVCA